MGLLSRLTDPPVGLSTPESTLSRVVLPQPEGPTTLKKDRGGISTEMSSSADTLPPPLVRYRKLRPSMRICGTDAIFRPARSLHSLVRMVSTRSLEVSPQRINQFRPCDPPACSRMKARMRSRFRLSPFTIKIG